MALVTSSVLVTTSKALVTSSDALVTTVGWILGVSHVFTFIGRGSAVVVAREPLVTLNSYYRHDAG